MSPSQKEIILKLSDVGWLYSQVKDFCEWGGSIAGNEHTTDRTAAGLVNQSLVLALREELNDYCRLIALLEAQVCIIVVFNSILFFSDCVYQMNMYYSLSDALHHQESSN